MNYYNSSSVITNKYNTSNSTSSNTNSNFLNKIIIDTPEYRIKLSDIYYYPNLTYIVNNTQSNIYLPDLTSNPYYNDISFKIINSTLDQIYIFSSNNCLIYSTFFNSVTGDKSMAIEGRRIVELTRTIINNNFFWNVLIN